MTNLETLQQNKAARQTAETLLGILDDELAGMATDRQRQRLLELLAEWIWPRLEHKPAPERKPPSAMTDPEARQFEQTLIGFGRYRDVAIAEVPAGYLAWFADQPDAPVKLAIRRYLQSPRGRDRLREEGEAYDD